MVDAADIINGFEDVVRIEIIAEQDGDLSDLKVKICREGNVFMFSYSCGTQNNTVSSYNQVSEIICFNSKQRNVVIIIF